MRTTMSRLLVAAIMVSSFTMFAAPANAATDSRWNYTNGCTIVPDVTPWANFTSSCNYHDVCYARYPSGAHQYGTNETGRARCDVQFLGRMDSACEALKWWDEPPCFATAVAYYNGVRLYGAPAYYDYNTIW